MFNRTLLSISFAVLAMAIASGCGGGGNGSSGAESSAPAITKAAFVKGARKICSETGEKMRTQGVAFLEKVMKESGKSFKGAEVTLVSEWLVPKLETEVKELRALGAPSGEQGEVDAIYEALKEVIALAKSNPKRYLYDQVNGKHPYREVEKLATAYGIPECGQP